MHQLSLVVVLFYLVRVREREGRSKGSPDQEHTVSPPSSSLPSFELCLYVILLCCQPAPFNPACRPPAPLSPLGWSNPRQARRGQRFPKSRANKERSFFSWPNTVYPNQPKLCRDKEKNSPGTSPPPGCSPWSEPTESSARWAGRLRPKAEIAPADATRSIRAARGNPTCVTSELSSTRTYGTYVRI
jgi:hypothetical protein